MKDLLVGKVTGRRDQIDRNQVHNIQIGTSSRSSSGSRPNKMETYGAKGDGCSVGLIDQAQAGGLYDITAVYLETKH